MTASLVAFAALIVGQAEDQPAVTDHTGISWVLPFEQAREKAAAENRLLLIKPIAFGTSPDGGW